MEGHPTRAGGSSPDATPRGSSPRPSVTFSPAIDIRPQRQEDLTLHVEVEGTQTKGEQVILTANEVKFAGEHTEDMVLFLVHSRKVSENEDGHAVARGGAEKLYAPWDVDDGELAAINYRYSVPES